MKKIKISRRAKEQSDKYRTFFGALSKGMLKKAKGAFCDFEKHSVPFETDFVYRYYHDSFKIFGFQMSIERLLKILLIFAGKHEKIDIITLRRMNFNKNFIQLIQDALSIKMHTGGMKKSEWQKMTSAYFNVKHIVSATIQTVEDFLNGNIFISPLDYHTALFLAVWNFELVVRYGLLPVEKYDLRILREHGSKDVKKVVQIYLRKANAISKAGGKK